MEQTKEKKYIVGSIICGLLTAVGVVACVISLMGRKWSLSDCAQLVLLALIVFYAFIGYKKPHGNLLKYIMFFRAVLNSYFIFTLVQIGESVAIVLLIVELGLTCYIAGRLAKVKENQILMLVVAVCTVLGIVVGIVHGFAAIGMTGSVVSWLDICVAYFLRYKQHREAGLEDAPRK